MYCPKSDAAFTVNVCLCFCGLFEWSHTFSKLKTLALLRALKGNIEFTGG